MSALGFDQGDRALRSSLLVACLAGLMGGHAAVPIVVHAATLFGVVNTGQVFASADQGASWTVRAVLPVHDAVAIAARQTNAELLVVTRGGSVLRSSDAGVNWVPVGVVTASDVSAMSLRSNGDALLLTETGSLYTSSDQGVNWTAIAVLTAWNFVSLARDGTGDFYALSRAGEVHRSTDNGASWIPVGNITTSDAVAIRSLAGALYVMSSTGDLYKSTDSGASWVPLSTISQVHTVAMSEGGGFLAVTTAEGDVATSPDGMTWQWRGTMNQVHVTALGVDTPQSTGVEEEFPTPRLQLGTPWPNPWRGGEAVVFTVTLLTEDVAVFELYNATGRVVERRAQEQFAAGTHTIRWDVGDLPGGVYGVQILTASGDRARKKWVLLR